MSYKTIKADKRRRANEERATRAAEREARIAKRYVRPKFVEKKPRDTDYLSGAPAGAFAYRAIPSLGVEAVPPAPVLQTPDHAFDPEWQARERAAKEQTEYLKKCTAPLYSKGPYQLITSPDVVTGINKKAGGL